jgi:hypothetical protein
VNGWVGGWVDGWVRVREISVQIVLGERFSVKRGATRYNVAQHRAQRGATVFAVRTRVTVRATTVRE